MRKIDIRRRTILAVMAALLVGGAALTSCFDVPTNPSPQITTEVVDWRDEVMYQIVTDRFFNGDRNNDYNLDLSSPTGWHGGDWQGIIDKMDYLEDLGVTALWISPVFKVVEMDAGISGYHGYWPQDFVSTNPHFGDMEKLRELVAAAHAKGMKVILDVVVNHIGQLFYYDINLNGRPDEHVEGSGMVYDQFGGQRSEVTRVTEWDPDYDPRGIHSRTSLGESGLAPIRWVYMPEDNRVPPMPAVFQNPDWYNRKGRVVTPWGWNEREQVILGDFPGGLKDIKTTLPEVREEMIRIYTYWIEQTNLDGFRIDTVKHVEDDFWPIFARGIRQNAKALGKDNFLMFGEIFDGDDALLGHYTKNEMLDSVFYFSHKYQVFDDIFKRGGATKKIEDLYNARQSNYGTQAHPNGIVDVHGQGVAPTRALVTFIDNHDVARWLYDFNEIDALEAALFYLLTMDGIPCIYYGTEQQFNGGNDPANREDMWDSNFDKTNPTYQHTRQLIALRKQYAPLRRGNFQLRWTTERTENEQDAGIVAFERSYDGESVLVVINAHANKTSETSATSLGGGAMPVSFPPGTVLMNVFEDDDPNKEFVVAADGTVNVKVGPRSGKILVKK